MNEELKQEQYELEGQSALLTEADEHFSIAISTIMSMTQNAYQIFKSSRVEAKRAILNILLSNLQIKDKQISYNHRKPFDLIDSLNEKTPPKIGGVAIGDLRRDLSCAQVRLCLTFRFGHSVTKFAVTAVSAY